MVTSSVLLPLHCISLAEAEPIAKRCCDFSGTGKEDQQCVGSSGQATNERIYAVCEKISYGIHTHVPRARQQVRVQGCIVDPGYHWPKSAGRAALLAVTTNVPYLT